MKNKIILLNGNVIDILPEDEIIICGAKKTMCQDKYLKYKYWKHEGCSINLSRRKDRDLSVFADSYINSIVYDGEWYAMPFGAISEYQHINWKDDGIEININVARNAYVKWYLPLCITQNHPIKVYDNRLYIRGELIGAIEFVQGEVVLKNLSDEYLGELIDAGVCDASRKANLGFFEKWHPDFCTKDKERRGCLVDFQKYGYGK